MILREVWVWLTTGANWSGSDGVVRRTLEHLGFTGITLLLAMAVAIPLGCWIAHTGRAAWLISVVNAARAIPSLGLQLLLVALLISKFSGPSPLGSLGLVVPTVIALVALALPPLLAGAYSGVTEIDPAARDAAKGMGMTGREVFFKVELPNALPLIFSGIRSATLQVVATVTIAAFVGLGGLGRYVIDGQSSRESDRMIAGAILVSVLALLLELALSSIQRAVVSPGLTGRTPRRRRDEPASNAPADAVAVEGSQSASREQAPA